MEAVPDVAMAPDHTDDSIKEEPHRVQSAEDRLGELMIASSVPPSIDDPEADVDWNESQRGSPIVPDIPMFGGGTIPDQPSPALPLGVEVPGDQGSAASIDAESYYDDHPQVPLENTRQYTNYRCSKCGIATSGYLVKASKNHSDYACNKCGGSAIIVRITVPLPAGNHSIPWNGSKGHWRASMRRATVVSAIRNSRGARRIMVTRRLERQRRGEVPSLVPGYVDITSNYYTAYTTPSSSSRRLSSGTIKYHLKHSKRPRTSDPRSVSEVDIAHDAHDMQDSDGFADIEESDEEASPPEDLPPEMLHQVQAYLDLTIATNQMPDYLDWNELDAGWKNFAFRSVDLNDDRVIETNMLFACRYMIAGWTGLFDLSARIAYAANELVGMMAYEVLIWCNMFCRMLHIDFIHLFTGVDTLSLRKCIDGDLDTDNTGPFFAFLGDHRVPFKGQPQWANVSVIYLNSWLANKWKRFFTEIGSGFQQVKWCYRPERGAPQHPYRNFYIHATAQILCFG